MSWWGEPTSFLQVVPDVVETPATQVLPPTGLFYSARMAGREMVDADGVFTQFYEHMRLPDYFGWNWDALRDCLYDLSWLTATHFLLTIDDAEFVLSGSSEERDTLYRTLVSAAGHWAAKPELPGQEKISFRTVLLCSPGAASGLSAELQL
ncbi:barstar family protein [Streptomyces sp. NPDC005263]|uniref:barstar family protein n=1 Tax=Streptomyces sp. NPDC005263 TaxID=3364711 RepID=UPI003685FD92